jgi:hypothetical protein
MPRTQASSCTLVLFECFTVALKNQWANQWANQCRCDMPFELEDAIGVDV